MTLTFSELRRANTSRRDRWHSDPDKQWDGPRWCTATTGELGEAANIEKKLARAANGVPAADDPSEEELKVRLAVELADTAIYLDLWADHHGIDLAAAIVAKFNLVSQREGFPEHIDEDGNFVKADAG